MQQRVLCVVCLLAVSIQGCKTIVPHEHNPLILSKQEKQLAESLSHFSQGLIYVTAEGSHSSNALKEYQSAITLAPEDGLDYIIPRLLKFAMADKPNMPSMEEIDKLCSDYYLNKLRSEPDNPLHYVTIARINFKNNNDALAIATIKKGLRVASSPDAIRLYCKMQGQEFYINSEYDRTVSCFELLSDQKSEQYERFHFILGELNEALGQTNKAIHNYTLACEGSSPVPEAFIQLAMIYFDSKPDKAIETMERAVETFPSNTKVLFFLGYIHGLLEDYDSAISIYEKIPGILESSTNTTLTAEFYLTYGATYEQSGNIDKAAEVFQAGLALHPENHEMLNYLAYMWAEHNQNLDSALEYAQLATELQNKNGAYIDTLGWIFYKKGDYKKAIENIRKALDLMPRDPVVMEHLGDAYKKIGKNEKAILWWKESYIVDHTRESAKERLKKHKISLRHARKEAKLRREGRQ